MGLTEFFSLSLTAILIENFVLIKFLGICPFLGVSKKVSTVAGMGIAVTFVMAMASALTYVVNTYLLVPFHLEYMQTLAFILLIAALVQLVEMFLQKSVPALYQALGIYLPLITTNCAVLGVALTNVQNEYTFTQSVIAGFGTAVGYTIAIVLLAGIRERIDEESIPAPFRGAPVVLLAAALMSIAFMGFGGLSL